QAATAEAVEPLVRRLRPRNVGIEKNRWPDGEPAAQDGCVDRARAVANGLQMLRGEIDQDDVIETNAAGVHMTEAAEEGTVRQNRAQARLGPVAELIHGPDRGERLP